MTNEDTKDTLTIRRTFDASRERVFDAWTDAEQVKRWWGPRAFTTPHCEIDPRPGGVFRYCMRSPEGEEYWSTGVFREVVEPERLVFTSGFSDADGNLVSPTEHGLSSGFPQEPVVTVTFEDDDGKTELTLEFEVGRASATDRENAGLGWNESLDTLAELVEE